MTTIGFKNMPHGRARPRVRRTRRRRPSGGVFVSAAVRRRWPALAVPAADRQIQVATNRSNYAGERAMAFAARTSAVAISEPNITPLVDVLLVLLVVFMLAVPPLLGRVGLQLPQPDPSPPPEQEPIVLRLGANGELAWNGTRLPREALAPQLRLEAARSPQPVLKVEVDAQARYGDAVTLLATAQNAGMHAIAFDPGN
jgi:biopolymer transport protein ExbD